VVRRCCATCDLWEPIDGECWADFVRRKAKGVCNAELHTVESEESDGGPMVTDYNHFCRGYRGDGE